MSRLSSIIALCLLAIALPAFAQAMDSHDNQCVVLLHGLARSSSSMQPMQRALEARGYVVANVDYPSRQFAIDELAPMAVDAGLRECQELLADNHGDSAQIHFVTHSLGGILLRAYAGRKTIRGLGRVVMLGPPNQGSVAVDTLRDLPGFDWVNGPAGLQLGKNEHSVPLALPAPDFEFAVIAGDRTIDPIVSAVLPNPDDGRVSVADTRLEGMADFRVVGASHAFMMRKRDVIELAIRFLETGNFDAVAVERNDVE